MVCFISTSLSVSYLRVNILEELTLWTVSKRSRTESDTRDEKGWREWFQIIFVPSQSYTILCSLCDLDNHKGLASM